MRFERQSGYPSDRGLLLALMGIDNWRRSWPGRRRIGVGEEVDDARSLSARRRRIVESRGDQIIKWNGSACGRVVKLPGRVGTRSGVIEVTGIDGAVQFCEISRSLRVGGNNSEVISSGE